MAYRNVAESLRAYRDRVASDLEDAKRAAQEAAQRAQRVAVLEKELAETEGLLSKLSTGPRKLPVLEDVAIAAPCRASWDEMVGDEHVRFCGQCAKNVYNLSSLPRDQAQALLAAREGEVCVRLYRRADGTVLTSDCPVGVRRRRRRRAVAGVVGGGLLAATASASLAGTATMGATRIPAGGEQLGGGLRMGAMAFPSPGTSATADPTVEPETSAAPTPTVAPSTTGRVMGRISPRKLAVQPLLNEPLMGKPLAVPTPTKR